MKNTIGLKKGDFAIILFFAAICVLLFLPPLFSGGNRVTAVIWCGGEKFREIDLSSVEESYEIDTDWS